MLCVRKPRLSGHRKGRSGPAVMTDVLSGEWLVEGREGGKDVSGAGSGPKM